MLSEFKQFVVRGNVLDMAVGIIIGAAFGTIVSSLVADVLMPPIGLALGGIDFTNMFVTLKDGAKAAGPAVARRGESGWGGDRQLRRLRQRHRQLPHRRLLRVPAGQGREQHATDRAARTGRADADRSAAGRDSRPAERSASAATR